MGIVLWHRERRVSSADTSVMKFRHRHRSRTAYYLVFISQLAMTWGLVSFDSDVRRRCSNCKFSRPRSAENSVCDNRTRCVSRLEMLPCDDQTRYGSASTHGASFRAIGLRFEVRLVQCWIVCCYRCWPRDPRDGDTDTVKVDRPSSFRLTHRFVTFRLFSQRRQSLSCNWLLHYPLYIKLSVRLKQFV